LPEQSWFKAMTDGARVPKELAPEFASSMGEVRVKQLHVSACGRLACSNKAALLVIGCFGPAAQALPARSVLPTHSEFFQLIWLNAHAHSAACSLGLASPGLVFIELLVFLE
jgi:hypothetical protein